MYCTNCGKEIDNKAVVCPHCGVPTSNYNAPQQNQPKTEQSNKALVTVAKVLIILSIIAAAMAAAVLLFFVTFFIAGAITSIGLEASSYDAESAIGFGAGAVICGIMLLFTVPSFVFAALALKKIKAKEKPSVALSVCVIIFTNIIAGILFFCTDEKDYL